MTWMTAKDAAARIGISTGSLRARAREGKITRKDGYYEVPNEPPPRRGPPIPAQETFHAPVTPPKAPEPPRAEAQDPSLRRSQFDDIAPAKSTSSVPVEKWILIPDAHVPYQNTESLSLIIRTAQAIGCTNVVVLGDFADCYAVSRFPKNPQRRLDLQWEIDEVNKALDLLDRVFTGTKKITLGNHEKRMERFIVERAPELSAMMKIEDMLRLKDRGWLVTDYMDHTNVGKLNVTHEAGNSGQNAHIQAEAVFGDNVAIGHTHRLSWSVVGSLVGKPHVCAMLGWIGDVDKIDYTHRARIAKNSAQGFGIAYVEPDGCVHLHPVAIVNGRCCAEGRIVQ